jgi:hypothetical protein
MSHTEHSKEDFCSKRFRHLGGSPQPEWSENNYVTTKTTISSETAISTYFRIRIIIVSLQRVTKVFFGHKRVPWTVEYSCLWGRWDRRWLWVPAGPGNVLEQGSMASRTPFILNCSKSREVISHLFPDVSKKFVWRIMTIITKKSKSKGILVTGREGP